MPRWSDLKPDPGFLKCLDAADLGGTRAAAIEGADQQLKKNWSNRFADACARMVATEVAAHPHFASSEVRPNANTNAEPVTFFVGGKRKKVDVVVSSLAVGLQLGISLKGMNFRDGRGLQFDKNLTGRTYELEDEIRVIRRTLPMAYIAALYFMPIAATTDKSSTSTSSFARTVEHLRARVGRDDPASPTQADRLDMAVIALYVPGDHEKAIGASGDPSSTFEYSDLFPRGTVRYFDILRDPPKRGRPKLELTTDLSTLVENISDAYREFTLGPEISWSDPEPD